MAEQPEGSPKDTAPARRWRARDKRMLVYLAIVGSIAAWIYIPRPWSPTNTLETKHHIVFSTATREQTEETARALELLYQAYSNLFGGLQGYNHAHGPLKVKLFKDREEFRWVNPNLRWAEAYYRKPYSRAYYSAKEINPHHWMLHEAVHQLNHEVAGVRLVKWLDEGLSEYFSTSRLETNRLALGVPDQNTYPVWWLDEIATDPELKANLRNGSVIPLRAIITNRGGPSMNTRFNLYYLHWWTLTHFLFETPRYRDRVVDLVTQGGSLKGFERIIGPVETIEPEWHEHVRLLKARLSSPKHPERPNNQPAPAS